MDLVQVDGADLRLARLFQLYVYEWSALVPIRIGDDGHFADEELGEYGDDDRVACLVVDDDAPAGFALATREDGTWHVDEFFILAGARRRGLGTVAAAALFASRPGRWTLTVRPENPSGLSFWRSVLPSAEESVERGDDGIVRTRLSFVI